MTAGHCVYNPRLGGWCISILVIPGQNESDSEDIDSQPFGTVWGRQAWTSTDYMKTLSDDEDWGLIELNEMKGLECGYIGITACEDLPSLVYDTHVTVTGYPNPEGAVFGYNAQYLETGPIRGVTSKRFFYDIDTEKGQSGSPIYYYDYRWNIVGIHTRGWDKNDSGLDKQWNSGVKINRDRYEFFITKRTE